MKIELSMKKRKRDFSIRYLLCLFLFVIIIIINLIPSSSGNNNNNNEKQNDDIIFTTQYIPATYTTTSREGKKLYDQILHIDPNVMMFQTGNFNLVKKIITAKSCLQYRHGGLINCFHPDKFDVIDSYILNPIENGFSIGVAMVNVVYVRENDRKKEEEKNLIVFANIMLNHVPSKSSLQVKDTIFAKKFASRIEDFMMDDVRNGNNLNFLYSFYLNKTQPILPKLYQDLRPGNLEKQKHKSIFRFKSYHLKSSRATDSKLNGICGKFSLISMKTAARIVNTDDDDSSVNNKDKVDGTEEIYPLLYDLFLSVKRASNIRLQLLNNLLALHDDELHTKLIPLDLKNSLNIMQEHLVNLSTSIFNIISSSRLFLIKGGTATDNVDRSIKNYVNIKKDEC